MQSEGITAYDLYQKNVIWRCNPTWLCQNPVKIFSIIRIEQYLKGVVSSVFICHVTICGNVVMVWYDGVGSILSEKYKIFYNPSHHKCCKMTLHAFFIALNIRNLGII